MSIQYIAEKIDFTPRKNLYSLFEELINKHSNEGDVVVDPYVGSGTTAVAAKNTNRIFICGEPSDEYFQEGYVKYYFGYHEGAVLSQEFIKVHPKTHEEEFLKDLGKYDYEIYAIKCGRSW